MTALTTPPAVRHLLIVQIGPVQEFIAQARRTRDLWFGSHLLSELSRAAAAAVPARSELVFPALPGGHPELAPCDEIVRDGSPPLSIANRVVVELSEAEDPGAVARDVRRAVADRWRQIATRVRAAYDFDLADEIDGIWNEQIDTLVEWTAAWAPLDRDYAVVRGELEATLGGRRRLREFGQYAHRRAGAPASSLDGGRVSVLADPRTRRARRAERRLLLGDNENLDAVGVVKRRGGNPEQFLSVAHVAATPWLRRSERVAAAELDGLRQACRDLSVEDPTTRVVRHLDRVSRPSLTAARLFPYNASMLYASRIPAVLEELGASAVAARDRAREWEVAYLRPLIRRAGEPHPYVACLVADGDRMGEAIDSLRSANAHRALTAELGRFPAEAHRIIEQAHDGIAVYAGGDDVLAFVPVSQAVACAEALRRAFADAVGPALAAARAIDVASGAHRSEEPSAAPTLSVGIGVGHIHESLGHLRALGARAERLAKRARNSLAVLIDKRSGGETAWTAPWTADPAGMLAAAVELLQAQAGTPARLPMGKVQELARLLRGLCAPRPGRAVGPAAPAALPEEQGAVLLRGEVTRVLSRVHRGTAAGLTPAAVGLELEASAPFTALFASLQAWVARMQVAHALASAAPGAEEQVP